MKRLMVSFLAFLLFGAGCRPVGHDVGLYVQLVCGSDRDGPPLPSARPTGAELNSRLHQVFNHKHYWELKRDGIELREGQTARRRVCADRDVEIELLKARQMAVRIYDHGKLARSRTQPLESAFFVSGWDQGGGESWFIVVRRDRPVDPSLR